VPATDALGVDVLGLADDSVLLLGQIESPAGQRAALWRLRGDGRADTDFGLGGVLLSSALDRAQPLGLLRDDGDAALIAVRVVSQGANWLEVHRWQPGQGELQLVARQPAPREWRGPVSLERRGGTLQWFDAGTTSGLPLATTGATNAATDSAAVTAPSLGNAGFNPFAVDDKPSNRTFEVQDDIVPWLGWAGGLLAAVLGVVAWHLRRSSVTDLGMLDTRTAQVEAAVRHLHAAPRPNTMVHKGMADAPRTARLAEPIRSDTAESAPGAISLADPADASPRLDHSETPSGLTPTRSTSVSVPVSGGDGCHNRLPRPAFGEPDNLKKIKGVGPVLEKMLHAEGTYYFWQVAEWAQADVAHVSSRMPSFKGRIERDAWVAQAAELACRPDSARKPQT
jgi:predicted flap endonuclease-1-like 5' DNA nuclease